MNADDTHKMSPNEARQAIEKIDVEFVDTGARQMTEEHLEEVAQKGDEIRAKLLGEGPLRRFVDDGQLMTALVQDYQDHRYGRISFWALAVIVFALLYILNPIDLIPDDVPGVGFLDDVTVLGVCLVLVEGELREYKAWKAGA